MLINSGMDMTFDFNWTGWWITNDGMLLDANSTLVGLNFTNSKN